jgi:hypothetical protein
MRSRPRKLTFLAAGLLALLPTVVNAQSTAFTYQGKLTDGANLANGSYDLQFALFDTGGTQIGSTLTRAGTNVSGGIFTVQLDFGISAFPGANRFLEIGVRPAGVGSFTILSPRQQISSTPYAIRTLNAATADTATNSTQLGGVAASQYVQTSDSRLSDSRPPTAGSANYIQNTTSQQTANFNISGNGTVNGITSMGAPGSVYGYLIPGNSPGPYPTIGFNTYGPSYQAGVSGYGGIFQFQNGDGSFIYYTGANVSAGQPGVYTPRFTIDKFGRVGIGVFSPAFPAYLLDVRAPGGLAIYGESAATDGTGIFGAGAATTGNNVGVRGTTNSPNGYAGVFVGRVHVSNNLGIGTPDPQRLLHVNGRARIGSIPMEAHTGSVCFNFDGDLVQCEASSLRLKTNIAQFRSGLAIVRRLRPISFNWKEDGRRDIGLGAEDVAKVAPSFTVTDDKGAVTGVKYERLNLLLINAVKEQQKQIEQMRTANANLSARLRAVEKRLRKRGRQIHSR